VVLHLFTDGRDSPPRSALELLAKLDRGLARNEVIGTVMGRFFAMDRKKAWARTRAAFLALTRGQGNVAPTAAEAIRTAYGHGTGDEMVPPTIIGDRNRNRVEDGDSVIFYNLRSDRARQLTKAFVQNDFLKRNPGAFRRRMPKDLVFVAMTSFGPDLPNVVTAFPSEDIRDTLPMVLGGNGYRQLYLAESEKFAHITFFFNGGYDHAVAGEERLIVPSPGVDLYTVSPVMSAPQLTGEVLGALTKGSHDFIAVNFANADMMGHTGDIPAAERALEVLDTSLAHIAGAVRSHGGLLAVTADHGNVEHMLEANGAVSTEHTTNPVPFILLGAGSNWSVGKPKAGRLADVAPTLLAQLGLHKPPVMTGVNLCPLPARRSS
jgi:2,3-bisphosphoglycerate-independent phosphoglycerate mutase